MDQAQQAADGGFGGNRTGQQAADSDAAAGRTDFQTFGSTVKSFQLMLAALLVFCGLILLFTGFFLPPEGEIHSSVLVAFGETCTFAGALFGVDYKYKNKS